MFMNNQDWTGSSVSATKSTHDGEMVISYFLFIYKQTTAAGTVQKKEGMIVC